MKTQEDYRKMLDELLACESGLTGWEVDFLDDVTDQERDLTPKQCEKIEQIYERVCG